MDDELLLLLLLTVLEDDDDCCLGVFLRLVKDDEGGKKGSRPSKGSEKFKSFGGYPSPCGLPLSIATKKGAESAPVPIFRSTSSNVSTFSLPRGT